MFGKFSLGKGVFGQIIKEGGFAILLSHPKISERSSKGVFELLEAMEMACISNIIEELARALWILLVFFLRASWQWLRAHEKKL